MKKEMINIKEENIIELATELKEKNEKAFIALKEYMHSIKNQSI